MIHVPHGYPELGIIIHGIRIIIFFPGFSYEFQIQNINLGQPTPHRLYSHMTPQAHNFFIIEGQFICNL